MTMRRNHLIRFLCAGLLGVAAVLPIACGSSGKGLIPTGDAGPLQSDFEGVTQAAQSGDCKATEAALLKTQHDFDVLPASVDASLRSRLGEGVSKLRSGALEACKQALPQATATTTTPKPTTSTTSTTTTPAVTQTSTTQTIPTTSTPTTTTPGGGTPAPNDEKQPEAENGQGGGTGVGGEGRSGADGSGGPGAGGAPREGGK
jgi:hypothetical protein